MSTCLIDRVVYAKLRSTSEFDVAGRSVLVPADMANSIVNNMYLGQLTELHDVKRVVGLFGRSGLQFPIMWAMPGSWADNAGRHWLYQEVLLIKEDDFGLFGYDPFQLEALFWEQDEFNAARIVEPRELTPPTRDQLLGNHQRAVQAVVGDGWLPEALTAALGLRVGVWIARDDLLPLIRACTALLPPKMRSALTFVTRTSQAIKPRPRITVATTEGSVSADGDCLLWDVDGGRATAADETTREIATHLAGLARNGDWDRLSRWHNKADSYITALGPAAPWDRMVEALHQSLRSGHVAAAQPVAAAPNIGFRQWLEDMNVETPQLSLARDFLSPLCEPRDACDALAMMNENDRRVLAGDVGKHWAGKLTRDQWWAALDALTASSPQAVPAVVDAAAGTLVQGGRAEALVSHALATPTDRPWHRYWAEAVRTQWEAFPSLFVNDASTFEAAFAFGDEASLPDWSWMKRFGEHYALRQIHSSRVGRLLSSLVDDPEACKRLSVIGSRQRLEPDTAIARLTLLWALWTKHGGVNRRDVVAAIRDAFRPNVEAIATVQDDSAGPRPHATRLLCLIAMYDPSAAVRFVKPLGPDRLGRLYQVASQVVGRASPGSLKLAAFVVASTLVATYPTHAHAASALEGLRDDFADWLDALPRLEGNALDVAIEMLCGAHREVWSARDRGAFLYQQLPKMGAGGDSHGPKNSVEWIDRLVEARIDLSEWPAHGSYIDTATANYIAERADPGVGAEAAVLADYGDVVGVLAAHISTRGREAWFSKLTAEIAGRGALLSVLCKVQFARHRSLGRRQRKRLPASNIAKRMEKLMGLKGLAAAIRRFLPRRFFGLKKLGHK